MAKPSEAIPPKPNPLPNISLSKPSNKYQSPSPHTSKNIIKISPVSKKIKKSKNQYITWKYPILSKKNKKIISPPEFSPSNKREKSTSADELIPKRKNPHSEISKNSFSTTKNTRKRNNTDDILNIDTKKVNPFHPEKGKVLPMV